MTSHEYTFGGASWNPAFRPNTVTAIPDTEYQPDHSFVVPEDIDAPAIILDEDNIDTPTIIEYEDNIDTPTAKESLAKNEPDHLNPQHATIIEEQPTVEEGSVEYSDYSTTEPQPVDTTAQFETETDFVQHHDTSTPTEPVLDTHQPEPTQPADPVEQQQHQHSNTELVSGEQHEEQHVLFPTETPPMIPEPSHNFLDNTSQPLSQYAQLEQQSSSPHLQKTTPNPPLEDPVLDTKDAGYEYEYQGETTAAYDAVDESVQAPLLDDEEAMPTALDILPPPQPPRTVLIGSVQDPIAFMGQEEAAPEDIQEAFGWNNDEKDDTFDGLGIQAKSQHVVTDAFGTADLETDPEAQSEQPASLWDDADADDTFESIAAQTQPNQHYSPRSPNVHRRSLVQDGPVAASQTTALEEVLRSVAANDDTTSSLDKDPAQPTSHEDDLAAMWSAALADDEFLDDSASVDPTAFFADDGEGFLDDFDTVQSELTSSSQHLAVLDAQSQPQGLTAAGHISAQPAGRYTPSIQEQSRQRIFSDQPQVPTISANVPATYGAYGQTTYAAPLQSPQLLQRPAGPQSSQSFVGKSKGGYASPYDLPEDIVQPRSRPARPTAAPVVQSSAPPRTTSMSAVPPSLARIQTSRSLVTPSPPMTSRPFQSPPQAVPPRPATASAQQASSGDFFADLPVIPKARIRPSGSYAPSPAVPSQSSFPPPPVRSGTMPNPSAPPVASMPTQMLGGLQMPDRLPLLPVEPAAASPPLQSSHTAPPATSRYSPSLSASSAVPPAHHVAAARTSPAPPPSLPASNSRYSPAPAAQPQGQVAQNKYPAAPPAARSAMPFAPRTSSPLAFSEGTGAEMPGGLTRSMSYQPGFVSPNVPRPGPPSRRDSEQVEHGAPLQLVQSRTHAPPSHVGGHAASRVTSHVPSMPGSPDSRPSLPYSPMEQSASYEQFPASIRPQTHSPDTVMRGQMRTVPMIERSATTVNAVPETSTHQQDTRQKLHPARRQFSADLTYAPPQDERAADGLERWKGSPILRWNPSGALVTSFPKQSPFYAAGHAIPTIKCTPGPITIHDSKTTFPMDDRNAKFPGPFSLKGKGKKKELIAWLSSKIEDLTRVHQDAILSYDTPPLYKHRVEEKVVLWKMTKLFLEHDNKVEGNAAAEVEARNILLPNLAQTEELAGEIAPAEQKLQSEPVNADALAQIRKHLLQGKREDAVWYATEQRLWSHALLIASVGGPELWKQVVQEFVRAQVKDAGKDAQSLAALYEVFAGNWEESIDELVPPSARAGFQMINKSGPAAKNPLDGLDQWRETLSLIISNRSPNDVQAIVALGRLLSKYGRVEAAHTCYLFARSIAKWAGADDAEADFVLLGADHQSQPHELAIDIDSVLLTEVYEYVLSIAPIAGSSPVVPHLQAYKLHHAFVLAEHGQRSDAQSYCDAIGTAVKSSTRGSPYYHAGFLNQVEDLNRCLSAAPQPSGSSWIPKPSMDKVSGSMWKRFNTFVAGDEDEQTPNGSGPASENGHPAGPFGKVTGDSPSMSREGSSADLYSAMSLNGGAPQPPMMGMSGPSKYAPSSAAVSRMPPDQAVSGRYAPQTSHGYTSRGSYESVRANLPERPGTGYAMYTGLQPQPPQPRSSSTPFGAYLPQGQQEVNAQSSQQLGVPRPEATRAASDYNVQYSEPSSRRESVVSGSGSATYVPHPSMEPSPYSPQLPLEQGVPAYGYKAQSARVSSPYQPGGSYTPSVSEDVRDSIEDAQSQGYTPVPQQESTSTYEPSQPSYETPQSDYGMPSVSYAPPTEDQVDDPESRPSAYATQHPYGSSSPYAPAASPYAPSDSYEPSSYEPPSASYEPPTSSYQPYEPEPDPEDQQEQPSLDVPSQPSKKKKSIMDLSDDEDDDIAARAAVLKRQQKSDADRAADEAFLAAAAADAARDSPSGQTGKKGWFGGWFKKGDAGGLDAGPGGDNASGAASSANKPIKAKLGEQNSFYYDETLKKWVNKKGGATPDAGAAAAATAPPPMRTGPPSRAPSGVGPPSSSSGPPSRVASASGGPPTPGLMSPSFPPSQSSRAGTPLSGTASAVPSGLVGGPPSRPGLSAASSIDDLLGAPGTMRKGAAGGTRKGRKGGGRYVDVMAKP